MVAACRRSATAPILTVALRTGAAPRTRWDTPMSRGVADCCANRAEDESVTNGDFSTRAVGAGVRAQGPDQRQRVLTGRLRSALGPKSRRT